MTNFIKKHIERKINKERMLRMKKRMLRMIANDFAKIYGGIVGMITGDIKELTIVTSIKQEFKITRIK